MIATPGQFWHIYCDESRQRAHRFMVLGGVILSRDFEPDFLQMVEEYRNSCHMHSELKWQKVSRGKLVEYQRFVDLLFDNRKSIYFKAIIIDTHQMNNQKYNKGDKELGFYKMIYLFLLHSFGRHLCNSDRCIVTLDQRNTQYKLSHLANILNNGLNKRYRLSQRPVRNIQAANSSQNPMIQLADVLMGAVGFQANGDDQLPAASQAKIELANYIARRARLLHLKQSTPRQLEHFSLWYFQFSGK
ncbi:MAG: DUF3800 domain-containing protein [Caldilineaceae bacterium]